VVIGTKVLEGRLARCVRPMHSEYITVGEVVSRYHVYSMTRKEFISVCYKTANGFVNPDRLSVVYDKLMEEAGLPPLEDK
jgi:hypothetical protein